MAPALCRRIYEQGVYVGALDERTGGNRDGEAAAGELLWAWSC